MAKALTLRQMSRMFAKQAVIQGRIAKLLMKIANDKNTALPADNVVTIDQLNDANQAFDNSQRAYYIADGAQSQADAFGVAADAAFAAGDASEAP